jgi:hypothetical protein
MYDTTEGFGNFDIFEYGLYSETSPDSIQGKYTVISKRPETPTFESEHSEENTAHESDDEHIDDHAAETPELNVNKAQVDKMPNDIQLEQMSTINTIYIGSLTIVGLYVLFRYLKY